MGPMPSRRPLLFHHSRTYIVLLILYGHNTTGHNTGVLVGRATQDPTNEEITIFNVKKFHLHVKQACSSIKTSSIVA